MTTANNSSYVPFLKDADLEKEVRALLEKAKAIQNKLDDEKMHKNVIDPFGSLIEQAGFDIDYNEWFKNERTWQMQKSLADAIGKFHQKIIGHIDGWQDLGTGKVVDLVHEDKKIIAEVKNKHNTVTASKLMDVYDILEGQLMPKNGIYRGYTSYLVQIIPAAPERYDDTFTPSNTKTGTKNAIHLHKYQLVKSMPYLKEPMASSDLKIL